MSKILVISVLLISVLLLAGCTAQNPTPIQPSNTFACPDGRVVLDIKECQPQGTIDNVLTNAVTGEKLTAADIYKNSKNSIYLVETTCYYEYSYDDFDIDTWNSPDTYEIDIVPQAKTKKISDKTVGGGSGFLANGKLYTNNHVVDCDPAAYEDELNDYFLYLMDQSQLNYYLNRSDIEDYIDMNIQEEINTAYKNYDYEMERKDVEDYLVTFIVEYLANNLRVKEIGKEIRAYRYTDNFQDTIPVSFVKRGESFPGRDYALFDINSTDTSLRLINQQNIDIGSGVFVMGYPDITLDEYVDSENIETTKEPPLITSGIISAKKASSTGVNYYVIDASAYYGSSGGPVINEKGEVIGILTAAAAGDISMNYILPISEIK